MRKDPPFDAEYIYSTYILERAELQGAFVANKPQGLRDMNEKVFTAWFPQCCAPTLITRSAADINAFAAEHGKIVVKPLDGMGGKSIFVTETGDKNLPVIIETLTDYGPALRHCSALPAESPPPATRACCSSMAASPLRTCPYPVAHGQPRQPGAGREGVGRELTERDRWLAAEIGPVLAQKGNGAGRAST
jgi:glutathione synthase